MLYSHMESGLIRKWLQTPDEIGEIFTCIPYMIYDSSLRGSVTSDKLFIQPDEVNHFTNSFCVYVGA